MPENNRQKYNGAGKEIFAPEVGSIYFINSREVANNVGLYSMNMDMCGCQVECTEIIYNKYAYGKYRWSMWCRILDVPDTEPRFSSVQYLRGSVRRFYWPDFDQTTYTVVVTNNPFRDATIKAVTLIRM